MNEFGLDELISVWILCLQLDFDAMTLFLISDFLQSVSVFPLSIYKKQRFYLVFNGSEMIFSIRGELMCWSVLFPRESEQIVPVHQMIWTFFFSSHNRFYWLEPLAPQIQTPHKPPTKKKSTSAARPSGFTSLCSSRSSGSVCSLRHTSNSGLQDKSAAMDEGERIEVLASLETSAKLITMRALAPCHLLSVPPKTVARI